MDLIRIKPTKKDYINAIKTLKEFSNNDVWCGMCMPLFASCYGSIAIFKFGGIYNIDFSLLEQFKPEQLYDNVHWFPLTAEYLQTRIDILHKCAELCEK